MTTTPVKAPQVTGETRKFTVDEYFHMVKAGILQEDERVELIEGEILVMAPTGFRHTWGVSQYAHVLISRAADSFIVQIRSTLRLGESSAPEPDLVVLKFRDDRYYSGYADPSDVLLVIEVADSSLAYDRDVKAHIYGQAAIPETWVLNLSGDCLERFTEPGPDGYAQHTTLQQGDKITPVALPDIELAVEDLLPSVQSVAEEE